MILVTTLNTRTISPPSPIWHPFLLYNRSSDEVYSAGDDIYHSCYPAGGESKEMDLVSDNDWGLQVTTPSYSGDNRRGRELPATVASLIRT